MAQDITQCLVKVFRRVWTPDIVWMKGKTHHTPAFHSFTIERVELVLDYLKK